MTVHKRRWRLTFALMKARAPHYEIGREAGINESRLSRIVHGRVEPTPEERARLAQVLGVPEEDLFGPE